ncbi:MAG: redoxin domain-containing protein [Thiopseudomonas sp.]
MQLIASSQAPIREFIDIHGQRIETAGKRTLLCFFRDPACPFCNFRIFELTYKHKELEALGLQVIALFPAGIDELKQYEAARPRPFPLIADSDSAIYEAFGVNIHSR